MNEIMGSVSDFSLRMFSFILIGAFLENTVLSRALGTSTALWMIRKKYNVFLFGMVITTVITTTSIVASLVYPSLQTLTNAYLWFPFSYILIISIIYILLLIITNRFNFEKKSMVLMFIHRCTFNCAVLGALLLSTQSKLAPAEFIGFGIGIGIGFTFVTYLVYIAFDRLNSKDIPKAFRGFPITLLYIGIISLAVYGIIGHELPI